MNYVFINDEEISITELYSRTEVSRERYNEESINLN